MKGLKLYHCPVDEEPDPRPKGDTKPENEEEK